MPEHPVRPRLSRVAVLSLVVVGVLKLAQAQCHAGGCTGAGCDPEQGTTLHDTGAFEHVNLALDTLAGAAKPAGCILSVSGGGLHWVGAGCPVATLFTGASFTGVLKGQLVTFTIAADAAHSNWYWTGENPPAVPSTREYLVTWSYKTQNNQPLCPQTPGSNVNSPALIIPGAWSTAGDYLDSSYHFTFACLPRKIGPIDQPSYVGGGVATKCMEWGYPPWAWNPVLTTGITQGTLTPMINYTPANPPWKVYETCVRMAMADYCGEGKPNTIDGTPIGFFNVAEVPLDPGKHLLPNFGITSLAVEAAWGIDSCGRVRALCLSKQRWASLPFDGVCAAGRTLPDPRFRVLSGTSINTFPSYCEDLTAAELEAKGALLYSYSAFIDVGLYRFRTRTHTHFLTTTSVVAEDPPMSPFALTRSYRIKAAGAEKSFNPANYQFIGFEGPIFAPTYNPAPGSTTFSQYLVTLYRCSGLDGGEPITTTGPTPGLCKDSAIPIGKILSPSDLPAQLQVNPLYRWQYQDGASVIHYVTAADQPAPEYLEQDKVLLGYMPPLGLLVP